MGYPLTRRNPRNACSDCVFGSRHFAFLTLPSHPLARWTRDGHTLRARGSGGGGRTRCAHRRNRSGATTSAPVGYGSRLAVSAEFSVGSEGFDEAASITVTIAKDRPITATSAALTTETPPALVAPPVDPLPAACNAVFELPLPGGLHLLEEAEAPCAAVTGHDRNDESVVDLDRVAEEFLLVPQAPSVPILLGTGIDREGAT
jgi:hypothetical protein